MSARNRITLQKCVVWRIWAQFAHTYTAKITRALGFHYPFRRFVYYSPTYHMAWPRVISFRKCEAKSVRHVAEWLEKYIEECQNNLTVFSPCHCEKGNDFVAHFISWNECQERWWGKSIERWHRFDIALNEQKFTRKLSKETTNGTITTRIQKKKKAKQKYEHKTFVCRMQIW